MTRRLRCGPSLNCAERGRRSILATRSARRNPKFKSRKRDAAARRADDILSALLSLPTPRRSVQIFASFFLYFFLPSCPSSSVPLFSLPFSFIFGISFLPSLLCSSFPGLFPFSYRDVSRLLLPLIKVSRPPFPLHAPRKLSLLLLIWLTSSALPFFFFPRIPENSGRLFLPNYFVLFFLHTLPLRRKE